MADGLFWLYRRVKKGKPYVKTENQDSVRKGRSMDGGYGRGILEVLRPWWQEKKREQRNREGTLGNSCITSKNLCKKILGGCGSQ